MAGAAPGVVRRWAGAGCKALQQATIQKGTPPPSVMLMGYNRLADWGGIFAGAGSSRDLNNCASDIQELTSREVPSRRKRGKETGFMPRFSLLQL